MPHTFVRALPCAALLLLASLGHAQDETVVLSNDDLNSYFVVSTTDPVIASTGIANPNPTLSLLIGQRYRFTFPDPGSHPFSVVARGAVLGADTDLLVQGPSNGSLETAPLAGVNWQNTSPFSNMDFTLTPGLAEAMAAGAGGPGYRCFIHTTTMRGQVTFRAQPSPFQWSTSPVTETFENAVLGTTVSSAFNGYAIVTDAPANYTAVVANTPAADAGQAAGSTRWITITDTHDAASVQDRVYPPAIFAPPTTEVAGYVFTVNVDVQDVTTGTKTLLIAQHDVAGTYRNVGGIEITGTGVNAIIIGVDEGGNGAATTVRTPVFDFTTPNMGLDQWLTLSFHMNFEMDEVHVEAIGSNGTATATAMATGLDLQGAVDPRNFRFCIRNTGAGNTSTISYDNLRFQGIEGVPAAAEHWQNYQ